jgi:hypothetical protein
MIALADFRDALGAAMGMELTPELAAAIEARALAGKSVVLAAVEPMSLCPLPESYSYRGGSWLYDVERFRDIVEEIHPLHVAHWGETEGYRHGLEMKPDYARLVDGEWRGQLVQFTVRETVSNALVGNLRVYLHRSTHTGGLVGTEDTLYLSPSARRGFNALRFLRFAEGILERLGVEEMMATPKRANNAGALLRRLGYLHVADQYSRILKKGVDHVQ